MHGKSHGQSRTQRRALAPFPALLVVACLLGLVAIALLDFTLPTPRVSPGELLAVAQGGGSEIARVVVMQLRAPRLILGILRRGDARALGGAAARRPA